MKLGGKVKNVIITAVLLSTSSVSVAASFECSNAKTRIEKAICSNAQLSKADDDLSMLYKNVKIQAENSEDLTADQNSWLRERNLCKDESCILEKYRTRTEELNAWIKKEAEKAKELESCTDRPECWPEGSAMHTGLMLVEKLEKADVILQREHEALVNLVAASGDPQGADGRMISALKAQQAAWLQFRSSECELIGSLTGAGGSWPSTYANKCEVNLTDARIRRVDSAIKCIEKISKEDRRFGMSNCLQQLAPLVIKV